MTDKKTRIVSNLLSLVLGAVIGAGVYAIKEQITHGGNERVEMEAPSEDVGGGVIFNEPEGNGMQLTARKLLSSEYDEYGVSELAETAYTLTATVTPANAMNKEVDWSVSFVDPTSAWASGKSVTEYVTVTPSADGALTATVENLDAFGAQIKITVASRFNADVKAETTVDYAKRITASNLKISRAAAHGSGYDFTEGMDPMPYLHPCMEHSTDLVTTTYAIFWGAVFIVTLITTAVVESQTHMIYNAVTNIGNVVGNAVAQGFGDLYDLFNCKKIEILERDTGGRDTDLAGIPTGDLQEEYEKARRAGDSKRAARIQREQKIRGNRNRKKRRGGPHMRGWWVLLLLGMEEVIRDDD